MEDNLKDKNLLREESNELDITCGMTDDEMTRRFIEAVRIENEIKRIKGVPIAGYDAKTCRAYLEYPDGRRIYSE